MSSPQPARSPRFRVSTAIHLALRCVAALALLVGVATAAGRVQKRSDCAGTCAAAPCPIGNFPIASSELSNTTVCRPLPVASVGLNNQHQVDLWNGTAWVRPAGGTPGVTLNAIVNVAGNLYVGGYNFFQTYDGQAWTTVGGTVQGDIMALAAFNGAVAVAGSLSHAGGAVASYFALWSPTNNSWTTPLTAAGYAGAAFAVADFGGSLAVGGAFAYSTDGVTITTRFLFVYNPALGTAVAVPVPAITGTVNSAYINAMAVYQGVLIVAGTGVAGGLAQWDGSTWAASPLGGGVDASGSVYTMTVFNGSLIVGGVLTSVGAGGTAASVNGLARYDGTTWFPMPLVNSTGAVIASGPGYVYGLGVVNGHLLVGGDPSFSPVFMIWDGQGLQGMGQSTPPGGGTSFAAYCTPGSNLFGPDCAGVCPPCAHGGTCSDGVHGNGSCACTPGWGGTTCDVCAPGHYGANCSSVCGACPSGAACSDGLNGDGTCHCAIGYLFYAGGGNAVCRPFPVASVGIFLGHGVNTWNGTAWAVAASTAGTMMAVASMDGYLYAGGNHVFSAYDGATLTDLTHVAGQTVTGEVMAMAKFQGSLAITGTLSFNQLSNPHGIIFGLWSNANQTWQLPLQGTAVNVAGYAVVEYRGHLIIGGSFQYSVAGNATVVTTYLLEYDPVAGTVAAIDASPIFEPGFGGGTIFALASYQGLLIVGGNPVVGGIAQWDGAARTWAASPLGGGLGYLDSSGLTVWALAVFNNDLIAGGSLTTAGAGAGTVNITSSTARYNGVAWTNMPLSDSAIVQPSNYAVDALAVVNGHLFSGGDELTVGIWDGDVWQRMCQTDSSVVNVGNSFATFCAPGSLVYGSDCTGFCAACGPHGVCLDGMRGNGSCQCDAHWAGAVCDTCAPAWNGTACDACAANYFGPTCTPCQCSGHGACNDGLSGTGACTCTAHWTGTHCDACEANWTGALCDACTPGHYGAACAACPNCGAHGTCRDGVGGNGTCACAAGWAGALCNVCASGFYGPSCTPCACVHGACNDGLAGNGSCACSAGWAHALCDACAPDFFGAVCSPCTCTAHGSCDDGVHGSGACTCATGWDGAVCDACAAEYYGPTCAACPTCSAAHSVCVDGLAGTGVCACATGWAGALCNTCAPGFYGPNCTQCDCQHGGSCDDGLAGNGSCACTAAASGVHCQVCNSGYYGAGCAPCTCGAHGTCNDGNGGDGSCACATGWNGTRCDGCASAYFGAACTPCTCGVHAVCADGLGGTGACTCALGWTGALCDACASGFFGADCTPCACQHGGVCDDGLAGNGTCACTAVASGPHCEACTTGFFGAACTACACSVHATSCHDGSAGDGGCNCVTGWGGATCAVCAANHYGANCTACPPCVHGTCQAGLAGSGACTCASGFTGAACNTTASTSDLGASQTSSGSIAAAVIIPLIVVGALAGFVGAYYYYLRHGKLAQASAAYKESLEMAGATTTASATAAATAPAAPAAATV